MYEERYERVIMRQTGIKREQARALIDAGIWTLRQMRATPDAGILAVKGIGQATLDKIRGKQ